jgi:small-conductance mechanosensitive channel
MSQTSKSSQMSFFQRHIWSFVLLLVIAGAKLISHFLPSFGLFKDLIIEQKWTQFFEHIFISAIVLLFFRLIYKFTMDRVARIFDEQEERIFYSKIYGWVLFSIGAFIVLNLFGLSLNNITLFIGIIATGFAFAVREVLLSFIGWLILLRKKPFRIGDHIRIGEEHGKVVHIGTYYVILDKTSDIPDDFTRIPNRFFLEKSIEKLGKSLAHEKIQVRLQKNPENRQIRIQSLEERLNLSYPEVKLLSANLDIEHDRLYLIFNFQVPFDTRSTSRASVVELVLEEFGDLIYFPED